MTNPDTPVDHNLADALTAVTSEIARTDSKASLLLALDGVLVAAVATLGTNLPAPAVALTAVGVAALVTATVLGILVVRPRLGGHDRASFPYWATCELDEIQAGMTDDRRTHRLQVLSRIAIAKMRTLQRASDSTLIAVIALAAAALITAAH